MASTTAAFRRLAYQAARGNLHQTALSAGFTAGSAQQPSEAWGDVHPAQGAAAQLPAKLTSSLLGLSGPAHSTQGLSLLPLGAASLQPPTLQQLTSQQQGHEGGDEHQQQPHLYQHLHQFQHQQGLRVILPSATPKTFTAGLPMYTKREVAITGVQAVALETPATAVHDDAVTAAHQPHSQASAAVTDVQPALHAHEEPSTSAAALSPPRQATADAASMQQQQQQQQQQGHVHAAQQTTDFSSAHAPHAAATPQQQPQQSSVPAGVAHAWEHQPAPHQYQQQYHHQQHFVQSYQQEIPSPPSKYASPAPPAPPVGPTVYGQPQQVPRMTAEGPATRKRTRGSVASIALNKEIMGASCVDDLLYIVRARGSTFDFFNISSAIARLPKLVTGGGDLAFMAPPAAHRTSRFGGQHQFGRHGSSASGVPADQSAGGNPHLTPAVKELAERLCTALVSRFLPELDARGVANTAWAFAKLRYVPDPALPALLSREALTRMPEFEPQHLSNLAWALVYMHHKDDALLSEIARRSAARLTEFKPQEVANVMWALASLDHLDASTADALGSRAGRLAPLLKEQELSNIVWSLGRAHHHDPRLLSTLLMEMRAKIHLFMPQGVSNVIWALGTLGHRDEGLLRAVASRFTAPSALRHFDAQALANLAWGLAALGRIDSQLMWSVACEAAGRVSSMSPGSLSSIAWACAVAGIRHEGLITALGSEAVARLHAFEPAPLAQLTWALAVLHPADATLLPGLGAACAARVDRLTGQALVQLAQACAMMSPQMPSELVSSLAARVTRVPVSGVTAEEAGAITAALQQALQAGHTRHGGLRGEEDRLADTASSSHGGATQQARKLEAPSQSRMPGAASHPAPPPRVSMAGGTSSGSTAAGAGPAALTTSLWSFAGGLGNGVLGSIWAAHEQAVPSNTASTSTSTLAAAAGMPATPQLWESRHHHHEHAADMDGTDVSSSVALSGAYQLPSDLYLH